ncbi:methanogenesis marker protein Mmp4/MtxX [Methanobrevibacter sp.]|uniref:methanogenesis marker protein Mmp4/MtxX n=1 Tax=Methanobrevibacter sp. TaxID=66852 RepID=UPI0025EFA660|nr:methanogenesis marker protein Mmp4/MtxX [Methanobrevibacter sp.]MBQ2962925.1 methanogenesis marker protein Mmp4/MtxX [Methanobrevibacter sp.]
MINIVVGLGENENIIKASSQLNTIDDLNITLVKTEDELINAFENPEVDAVIRGSLRASKVIKAIKELKSESKINRTTYINTRGDERFSKDYEFLLAPVGIDEGKNTEEKITLAVQAADFIQYLGKKPKIAILAEGRKDDLGRSERIDESLKSSQELTELLINKFDELDNFDNGSEDISKNYSIKNYYILLEQAIEDGNNIILANDGIFGNILFRTLVLLDGWPSYGAVTLGIDEIFIDTSRDQSVEGYKRSLELAYKLAKLRE